MCMSMVIIQLNKLHKINKIKCSLVVSYKTLNKYNNKLHFLLWPFAYKTVKGLVNWLGLGLRGLQVIQLK